MTCFNLTLVQRCNLFSLFIQLISVLVPWHCGRQYISSDNYLWEYGPNGRPSMVTMVSASLLFPHHNSCLGRLLMLHFHVFLPSYLDHILENLYFFFFFTMSQRLTFLSSSLPNNNKKEINISRNKEIHAILGKTIF